MSDDKLAVLERCSTCETPLVFRAGAAVLRFTAHDHEYCAGATRSLLIATRGALKMANERAERAEWMLARDAQRLARAEDAVRLADSAIAAWQKWEQDWDDDAEGRESSTDPDRALLQAKAGTGAFLALRRAQTETREGSQP